MIAIPAVDLSEGKARSGTEFAGTRPAMTARILTDLGFTRLHLEDFGTGVRSSPDVPAIEEIVRDTDASIQVAGPTSGSEIERLFRTGAEHIVVGDRCIDEPEWLASLSDLYPDAIVVRTDVRDRRVVRRGWVRTLPIDVLDLVEELSTLPLAGVLVGGLQLGGTGRNTDLALVEDLVERSRCAILVSLNADTIDDLRALEHRGAAAVVLRGGQLLSSAAHVRTVAQEFGS